MSTTTTTTVPAEVQLTPAQTKIQSLLRSTELRISLITTHLRALRLEKTLLLAVLPPLRKQSPADINRVNELGEKILAVERRMERDEEHKKWLEEAMRATVEHGRRKARGDAVQSEPEEVPVFEWERLDRSVMMARATKLPAK